MTAQGYVVNEIPLLNYIVGGATTTAIFASTDVYTATLESVSDEPLQVRITDFELDATGSEYRPQTRALFGQLVVPSGGSARLVLTGSTDVAALQWQIVDPAIPGITTVQADDILDAAAIQDVTPPTTTLSVQGSRGTLGYFVGPVTVTIAASDAGTGVELTQYSVDGGQTWVAYSQPL